MAVFEHRAAWQEHHDARSREVEDDDANYSDTTIDVEDADRAASETQVLVIPQGDGNDTNQFDDSEKDDPDEGQEDKGTSEESNKTPNTDDRIDDKVLDENSGKFVNPKKSFKDALMARDESAQSEEDAQMETSKPMGFWDEAVTLNQNSQKRKSAEGDKDSGRKLAKDDCPTNMDEEPETERPQEMEPTSPVDGDQDLFSDEDKQPTQHGEDDWVVYKRGVVQRYRKKRTPWARKPKEDSQGFTQVLT